MKIQKHLKEVFFTMLVILITTGTYAALPTVSSGTPLTSTIWNDLVWVVNTNSWKLNWVYNIGSNLGIWTSSPWSKLHVKSSSTNPLDSIIKLERVSGSFLSYFQNLGTWAWATNVSSWDQALIFSNDGNPSTSTNWLYIWAHSTLAWWLKIMENWNVWVWVANPMWLLDVWWLTMFWSSDKQMATSVISWLLTSYSWSKTLNNHVDWEIRAQSWPQLYLKNNWNVWIWTATPWYLLDVLWTIRWYWITDSSDIRLKENIENLWWQLENISKVEWVKYEWKNKNIDSWEQIWVIAQDLEKIYPQLVKTDKDWYKSVNYSHLVVPLIEALKELKKENEDLKKRVEALENK